MMEKVVLPKGLIRYASENSIAEQKPHTYTIRAKAYTVVLVILLGVMGFLLAERPVVEATVLRATGLTYQSQENNEISNLYRYKIINKSTEPQNFELKVLDDRARLEFVGVPDTEVGVQKLEEGAFFVYVKRDALNSSNEEIKIAILVNNKVEENLTLNFLGPRKKSK
jgi:polyferredoxin